MEEFHSLTLEHCCETCYRRRGLSALPNMEKERRKSAQLHHPIPVKIKHSFKPYKIHFYSAHSTVCLNI